MKNQCTLHLYAYLLKKKSDFYLSISIIFRTICMTTGRMVLCAAEKPPGPAKPILDWPTVNKQMPWSVIILLGGGFALADACKVCVCL